MSKYYCRDRFTPLTPSDFHFHLRKGSKHCGGDTLTLSYFHVSLEMGLKILLLWLRCVECPSCFNCYWRRNLKYHGGNIGDMLNLPPHQIAYLIPLERGSK